MPVEEWFMYGVPAAFPPRSPEELRVRTLMGALDALKGGITTLQDMMSFYPYDVRCVATALDAYDEVGIRCVFAMQIADAPGPRGTLPFLEEVVPAELKRSVASSVKPVARAGKLVDILTDELQRHRVRHPRVTWALGPAQPEICSDELMQGLAVLAERENLHVFTHLYTTKATAVTARMAYGEDGGSLIRYLRRMGLLGPRLTIAHGVWLTREEIGLMAEAGAHVALCPMSNMKTKNGVAPFHAYVKAGVNVGLGTDNCSVTDSQSMFQAMKMVLLLSALGAPVDDALSEQDVFRAATEGSAAAVGLAGTVGALRAGAKADITLLDLKDPSFVPLNDAVRQLVASEAGRGVRHVLVDGQIVIRDRCHATIDEDALYEEAERLNPGLMRDLEAIRARNRELLPYFKEALRRTLAVDVGLDRFIPGDPQS
jgi:cytosine/adenosine deaminase-related metal-dependent hydrolase